MPVSAELSLLRAEYAVAYERQTRHAIQRLKDWAALLPPGAQRVLRRLAPGKYTDSEVFTLEPYAIITAKFFGINDEEVISDAEYASLLMQIHCCLQDHRIDVQLPDGVSVREADALSNLLLAESLAVFSGLARHPEFPACVRRAFSDLYISYETEAAGGLEQLSEAEQLRTYADRAAPLHILIAAMGYRSGRPEKIEACSELGRILILCFQILDDLTDWRDDLAAKRRSYLFLQLVPVMQGKPFEEWQPAEVEDAILLFGGAEGVLKEGERLLDQGLEIVRNHAAAESQDDGGGSLELWLRSLKETYRGVRNDCLERKRLFLREVSGRGAQNVA